MHRLLSCAWGNIEIFTGVTQGHILCRGERPLVPGKADADLSINQPWGKWSSMYSLLPSLTPLEKIPNAYSMKLSCLFGPQLVVLRSIDHACWIFKETCAGSIQLQLEPQTSLVKAIGCLESCRKVQFLLMQWDDLLLRCKVWSSPYSMAIVHDRDRAAAFSRCAVSCGWLVRLSGFVVNKAQCMQVPPIT